MSELNLQIKKEMNVLMEVSDERERQDQKWGGAAHDDEHDVYDFVEIIKDYAGWACRMDEMGSHDKARKRLIQVAALAVAAVESIDRKHIIEFKTEWKKVNIPDETVKKMFPGGLINPNQKVKEVIPSRHPHEYKLIAKIRSNYRHPIHGARYLRRLAPSCGIPNGYTLVTQIYGTSVYQDNGKLKHKFMGLLRYNIPKQVELPKKKPNTREIRFNKDTFKSDGFSHFNVYLNECDLLAQVFTDTFVFSESGTISVMAIFNDRIPMMDRFAVCYTDFHC